MMWLLTAWGGVKRMFGLVLRYPLQAALIIALVRPMLPSKNPIDRACVNVEACSERNASSLALHVAYRLHFLFCQFRLPMPFAKGSGSVKQSICAIFFRSSPSKVRRVHTPSKTLAATMRCLMNTCGGWSINQSANFPAHINRSALFVHLRSRFGIKRERPKQAIFAFKGQNHLIKKYSLGVFWRNYANRRAISSNPFVVHIAHTGRFHLYRIAAIFNLAYEAVSHSEVSFRRGQGQRLFQQLIWPAYYGRFPICSQGPLSCYQ